ncbi:MAG: anti-sigma factor antagonist [Pseudonocardiales bacterium]|jgi:anti-anti-sigma factor|nr:anti-sigma factor antagonist [Pseudonocardiales bacterium]
MTPLLQRVPADHPARAAAVRPDFQPDGEVLTVTVCPAPPDVVVLAVCGEVDSSTSPLLRDRLLEQLRPTCPQLAVDLTEVSFFGAAGITVLVAARRAAETAGIRMCLVARTRVVLLPLTITGLDSVFDVCPDLAHARLRMSEVAAQSIGGSLDDDGILPRPRAGHRAPSPA